MRSLRTNLSCLAVLAGIAAVSIAATSGSAFAAKACAGGPVCVMKADGPKTYDSACAAKADGAKSRPSRHLRHILPGLLPRPLSQRRCAGWIRSTHARMTYPNNCAAENARAIWIHDGPCKK